MSYRQPAFMIDHPLGFLRDVSTEIVVNSHTEAVSDLNKRALIDYRQGSLCTFVTKSGSTLPGFNAGPVTIYPVLHPIGPNRLVIPAGHTFDGYSLRLRSDNNIDFTDPTTALTTSTISGSGVIDEVMSPVLTTRFWQIYVLAASSSDTFKMGQWWVGDYMQLMTSRVQPGFENSWQSQVDSVEYPSGIVSHEVAPPLRKFSLDVRGVDPTSADYTIMDRVLLNAGARPFWYWPPDDTDAGPFLVKLETDGSREQDFSVPSVNIHYRFKLQMIEQKV